MTCPADPAPTNTISDRSGRTHDDDICWIQMGDAQSMAQTPGGNAATDAVASVAAHLNRSERVAGDHTERQTVTLDIERGAGHLGFALPHFVADRATNDELEREGIVHASGDAEGG